MGIAFQKDHSTINNQVSLSKRKKSIKMNTFKVALFALFVASAYARPQDFEYDDDLDETGNFNADVIQRLAAQDLYDVNPTYSFTYQVADEEAQTYIKQEEKRDNNVVSGQYSYVDPLGALITVTYTADDNGYQETRTSQPNFVSIRNAPVVVEEPKPIAPKPAPAPAPQKKDTTNDDLIARIISQLTPFIKSTVNNSLGSA